MLFLSFLVSSGTINVFYLLVSKMNPLVSCFIDFLDFELLSEIRTTEGSPSFSVDLLASEFLPKSTIPLNISGVRSSASLILCELYCLL